MDVDPQNALRLHFGVPLADHAGFGPELARGGSWRGHIRQTPAGVSLLPHGTVGMAEALTLANALERMPERLTGPLRELLADPSLIVVADLPPGPSRALDLIAPLSDMVMIVLLADAYGAALMPEIDTGRFLGLGGLYGLQPGRLRLVLNQVDYGSRLSRTVAEALARHLGPRLLGAIAREDSVAEALAAQQLVLEAAPACRAGLDLRELGQAVAAALPLPAEPPAAIGAWWAR